MGETDRQALEAFVVENADLERLESLLGQFNLFEALGAVRSELRHSDFLSFLLDPSQSHGLGDAFLKRLLQRLIVHEDRRPAGLSPVDLDVWDLSDTLVLREWQGIDLLCISEARKLVLLIENKVDASEHGGQLGRYHRTVEGYYPGYRLVPLFLTPEGDAPSDDRYLALSYGFLCETLEKLLDTRGRGLGADVRLALVHYTQMLRRHIVSESEIADLARQIYTKHRRALDLIFEHRPDLQAQLADELKRLVEAVPDLQLDNCTKAFIRFCPKSWDGIPALHQGQRKAGSGRLLLFEFKNTADSLRLYLLIGPGPDAVRRKLFEASQLHPEVFRGALKNLFRTSTTIWVRVFLARADYLDVSTEDLLGKVKQEWERFVAHELPALTQAVEQIDCPAQGST